MKHYGVFGDGFCACKDCKAKLKRSLWINDVFMMAIMTILVLVLIFLMNTDAEAKTTNKISVNYSHLVALAIIGEAEGESYQGKLAVAYAIINRGNLQGVYGLNAPRVKGRKYSDKTYKEALKAYKQALNNPSKDITHGATHWEGTAFKTPYWAKSMTETVTIGKQRFYK